MTNSSPSRFDRNSEIRRGMLRTQLVKEMTQEAVQIAFPAKCSGIDMRILNDFSHRPRLKSRIPVGLLNHVGQQTTCSGRLTLYITRFGSPVAEGPTMRQLSTRHIGGYGSELRSARVLAGKQQIDYPVCSKSQIPLSHLAHSRRSIPDLHEMTKSHSP
jgi:hypothetical protein